MISRSKYCEELQECVVRIVLNRKEKKVFEIRQISAKSRSYESAGGRRGWGRRREREKGEGEGSYHIKHVAYKREEKRKQAGNKKNEAPLYLSLGWVVKFD